MDQAGHIDYMDQAGNYLEILTICIRLEINWKYWLYESGWNLTG